MKGLSPALRPARPDDLRPVAEIVRACDDHDLGDPDPIESTLVDLRADWQRPGYEAWVAEEGNERVIAWTGLEVHRLDLARIDPNGGVLPAWRSRGVGAALVERAEARARVIEPQPRLLTTVVVGENPSAIALFEGRGYRRTERSWHMSIELDGPPREPVWPAGLAVRTYRPGSDDRPLYELIATAFADNEGYDSSGRTFEEFEKFALRRDLDPSLYFVVEERARVVGAVLCPQYPGEGWIRQLAVHRDYRGRGLGTALLRHAFGEFYRRDLPRAGLTVDSWNTTGAKRLYEREGMTTRGVMDHYERPL